MPQQIHHSDIAWQKDGNLLYTQYKCIDGIENLLSIKLR